MPPVTLESGHWVTPSLRLNQCIDEGAMGSVWLADHSRLDTEVVVKFVRENLASDETVRRRLEIEARAAARIRSPHVVRVFDFGVFEETTPYIVMEHLVGQSLRDRLDPDDTLSLRDTMVVVNHCCRALQEAHRLGIVHRDIKPANLFLLEDEVQGLFVKVLDFGVAKGLAQQITEPGGLVGTPAYLSPEQLKDQTATHLSDLWALAAVTYECIVGDGPFHGETVDEVFARIWRCHVDPPSITNPQISPELDAWFARALGRQADLRPQSASEFATSFFDAALTCEEMLNAPDEEWSSTRWRLELDGPRSTMPHGTPSPKSRPRRVSAVELTTASGATRTLSGEPGPRSTSHWSERPPESRPPEERISTMPAPDADPPPDADDVAALAAGDPARDEEERLSGDVEPEPEAPSEAEIPPAALVPMKPRSRGRAVALGLGIVALLGVGLWFTSSRTPAADGAPAARAVPTPPSRDAAAASDAPLAPEAPEPAAEPPAPPAPLASAQREAPRARPASASAAALAAPAPVAPPTVVAPKPQAPAPPAHAPTKHGKELGF